MPVTRLACCWSIPLSNTVGVCISEARAPAGLIPEITGRPWGNAGFDLREPPVELCFSDHQEQELGARGFIPITYFREAERLCIFSAPSIQNPGQDGQDVFDKLAASLPYLYLVSRIAHYHKSVQRENVGTVKDPRQLDKELSAWLKTLITRMPDPDLEMRTRFPLRDGSIQVLDDPASPGFFTVKLMIQPHLQLEGVNAQLTLISKMPRKE